MTAQRSKRLVACLLAIVVLAAQSGAPPFAGTIEVAEAQSSCPVNQYRAEYFANASLSGSPVVVRCESDIDYRWDTDAPANGVPADNFSVRWTGKHRFDAGKYRFNATMDDGIKFWLDGVLTLSEWRVQSRSFMRERTLAEGEHEIIVEYYDNTAAATAKFSWEKVSSSTPTAEATSTPTRAATVQPTSTAVPRATASPTSPPAATSTASPSNCPNGQYRAEYFDKAAMTGAPVRSQCESAIAYRWGTGGPGGVGNDDFAVRWTGRLDFEAGTYTIRVFSDDGVRLWIDGALILDEWRNQAQGWEIQRSISDGLHDVKVEYFEGGGGATIEVGWTRTSGSTDPTVTPTPKATDVPAAPTATATAPAPTPIANACPLGQYRAEYFPNNSFSGSPVASRCENAPIAADWQYGAPYASLPKDSFSVRYVGRFKFGAGDHTFTSTADDSARVWLNGTPLIDDPDPRPGSYTATRSFPPGVVNEEHEIRVEFVESGGIAKVRFDWDQDTSAEPTPQPTSVATPTTTPTTGGSCSPTTVAAIDLPDGFCIEDYATGLTAVRFMTYGPDGVLYATLPSQGRVVRLPDANGDGKADGVYTFASGLNRPHGVVFHNGYLYVAETNSLTRLRDTDGDGDSDQIQRLAALPGDTVHWTRTVIVGADGKLYVSIGSSCDACIETDTRRSTVMQFNADGTGGRIYSRGLRNAVGLARNPSTGQIWADGNERDGLGDDFPREVLSRLADGADFGWPRCVNGTTADTRFSGGCAGVTPPALTFQAHSAPLGMNFYTGSVFPSDYRGDLFIAFHGSWNRTVPTGYKIIRVPFANGQPTGEVFDFATGWLRSDRSVAGRPVDVVTAPDGSMLISDDKANRIYRVFYRGSR